ncbi:cholecystokinin receptor type A-like [Ylistrum balloti]|uniref:cholecystokinin receptor type A-like n=1 Tax=Ylistrum balloti TaxID=509963 RepID=UPI002905E673|nr:cholecystokinin receptor type A-like [Ylistrum balloti]
MEGNNSIFTNALNVLNGFVGLLSNAVNNSSNDTLPVSRQADSGKGSGYTLEQWNWDLAQSFIGLDVFLGLYILLGVSGNILIIIIYQFKIKKKFEDRFFIMVLAVLDICVCVTGPATYLLLNILPVTFYDNWGCKIAWFNGRNLSNTSGMLILVIAIQRYLKVCRPFGWQMTIGWQKAAVIVLLIASVLIDIPILFFYGTSAIHNTILGVTGSRCGRRTNVSTDFELAISIYFYCMFVTALSFISGIAFMYVLIGRRIFNQMKRKREMEGGMRTTANVKSLADMEFSKQEETSVVESQVTTQNVGTSGSRDPDGTRKTKKKKDKWATHRYSLMFMTISAITGVTYVPSLIVNMCINLDSDEFWIYFSSIERQVYLFIFQFFLLNHVSNPFIYGFFDSSFRAEMKKLFRR